MDSVTKEYLHTREDIREELMHLKSQQNMFKFQISKLYEENKRLTSELKENAELRYLHLSESEVGQLEQKLQAAVASKNAAVEMWQTALEQLEKQEEQLVGKRSIVATERNELEKQFLQMKDDHAKSVNLLSEELSHSRSEISKLKHELDARNSELEKCKTGLSSAHKEIDISKKTISDLSVANTQLTEKIISFQSSLSESDKALDAAKDRMSSLNAKNVELSGAVSKLEEQNKKFKSEIFVYEKDAKDSLLAAEQAILQKKEVLCKEEQYQNEIKMLKSSIDVEKEKVIMRYRTEMKDIQQKASEKIKILMSEIEQLHKQIGEKQNLFERANREKQALESKVEMLFSENSSRLPVSNSVFDDMCKRLTMAERAKNELGLKVASLEITLQEVKSAKDQEIQYYLEKQNSLKGRLRVLSNDFNQASSDRVKLLDEVTKLKKKTSDQEKELVQARTKYANELSKLETELHKKQQALQEQLHFTEEHYRKICQELRTLLEAEFKISNKWKTEVKDLISQSEATIKELLQKNICLKNSNAELINLLHENNLYVPSEVLINIT